MKKQKARIVFDAASSSLAIQEPPSALAQLWRTLDRLKDTEPSPQELTLGQLRDDPTYCFKVLGLVPDPWQEQAMVSKAARLMLLWSRQIGKSLVVAAIGLRAALFGARVLIVAPVQDQAGIIYEYVLRLYYALGEPVPKLDRKESVLYLANGGKVIPKSDTESLRGFPDVGVIILDEAALVEDQIYSEVLLPMLVRKGRERRLIALSTPHGQRGWFHKEWITKESTFEKIGPVTVHQCPHINWDQLNDDRRTSISPRAWRQEYECKFESMTGAVFSEEDLSKAFRAEGAYRPLWPEEEIKDEMVVLGNDKKYRPVVEAF